MADFLKGTVGIIFSGDIVAVISYLIVLLEITFRQGEAGQSIMPSMLYIQNKKPRITQFIRDRAIKMDYTLHWETFMSDNYSRFLEGPAIPVIVSSNKKNSKLPKTKMFDKNKGVKTTSILKVVREVIRIDHIESWNCSRIRLLDSSKDFNFFGSHTLLKRVIYNLLVNTMKCSDKKSPISIWTEGRTLHLKNSASKTRPNSIGPTTTLSHTNNIASPGLAFCNTVISKMGGTISCRSELGKYTEFAITLPNAEKIDHLTT